MNAVKNLTAPRLGEALLAGVMALLCLAEARSSVTIDYTAQIGQREIVDHKGELVSGREGEVWLGTVVDGFDMEQFGGDLHRLREAWIPLASTTIRPVLGAESRFSARAVIDRPDLSNRKLYLWVLTTTNRGTVARDFGNVASHGVFSSSGGNWRIPSFSGFKPQNSAIITSSQVNESFGAGKVSADRLELTPPRIDVPDYHSWEGTAFDLTASDEDRQPLADPDHDSLVNLMERFLGTDPMKPTPSPFQADRRDGFPIFEYLRSKEVRAGAATLFISRNLTEWAETGAAAEVIAVEDLGARERVTIRINLEDVPASWHRRFFLRLEVSD